MAKTQDDLVNVINYSKKNNMVPHEEKFVYLRYKTKNSSELLNYLPFAEETCKYSTTGGHEIIPSDHTRDLGILMSPDYTWDLHIATMTENARDTAAWALGVFKDRSAETMLTLYNSLIRSRVEFCSPLWNPLDIGNIQKLEDVQRQFTRRIIGQRSKDYWQRLQSLNLMSLQRRRERYQIIHIWKILNGYAPNDLNIELWRAIGEEYKQKSHNSTRRQGNPWYLFWTPHLGYMAQNSGTHSLRRSPGSRTLKPSSQI